MSKSRYNPVNISLNEFNSIEPTNILNKCQPSSFSNELFLNQLIKSENELIQIAILKDRVFQIYKKHINNSVLVIDSRERLKAKNYIYSTGLNDDIEFFKGLAEMIAKFSRWMTKYTKELPGFNSVSPEDLQTMILNSFITLATLHINEFYIDNELYFIIPNGYQLSIDRLKSSFGTFNASLSILSHSKIRLMKLTENELSIMYPFVLCNSSGKDILILFYYFIDIF